MSALKFLLLATAALFTPLAAAEAGSYPEKPIRLIVPWPAGGSADAIARLVASALGNELRATLVVENVGGASGTLGTQQFTRAQPDGYTLLLATSTANASAPNLMKKVGFDPVKDFTPIGAVALVPSVLVVPANSQYKTPKDIVDAAKKNPGKVFYGSGGNGNSGHLSGALFESEAKIDAEHVPYKGNSPAMNDLMGGQLDFMFDNGAIPFIKSGRVRALAIASTQRIKALPEVPTFAELGMPNVHLDTWFGLAAPANTPPAVVSRLSTALTAVLKSGDLSKRLQDLGAAEVPGANTPDGFAAFWKKEIDRYRDLIKLSGAIIE